MPVQHRKEDRMTGYNALWDKQAAKDTADHVKSRVDNYTELVNGRSWSLAR
jgi:outer membrane murein-binding lipoprotein Lpp